MSQRQKFTLGNVLGWVHEGLAGHKTQNVLCILALIACFALVIRSWGSMADNPMYNRKAISVKKKSSPRDQKKQTTTTDWRKTWQAPPPCKSVREFGNWRLEDCDGDGKIDRVIVKTPFTIIQATSQDPQKANEVANALPWRNPIHRVSTQTYEKFYQALFRSMQQIGATRCSGRSFGRFQLFSCSNGRLDYLINQDKPELIYALTDEGQMSGLNAKFHGSAIQWIGRSDYNQAVLDSMREKKVYNCPQADLGPASEFKGYQLYSCDGDRTDYAITPDKPGVIQAFAFDSQLDTLNQKFEKTQIRWGSLFFYQIPDTEP